jgi:hypothetical protein
MPIFPSRLDGQTLGFSLTAPDTTVDVLSLDIVSGAVTSAYLTSTDILNLQPAVTAIFSLVPSGQRAAGALGMLQRLVTLAPAAAAGLTQAAINTAGTVYALRATISAAPSQFIVHLPFSADGQLAWATGIDVAGVGTVTSITAGTGLSGGTITGTGTIALVTPVATANGGTAVAATGASNGLFGVGGGVGALTPLISATRTVGAEVGNVIPVDIQLKNGTVNYTAEMQFWGQFDPGATLANITVAAGAAGQVFPMADFATSGRFVMISSVAGLVNLRVTNTTVGETILFFYGPGPGTNQIFIGGENELTFA